MEHTYQLYLSHLNNPFENLAIEDWLLRDPQFQHQSILFFYINTPSVVIGRAQNPWIECDIKLAKKLGIDLVRRQSGGGTVYHDLGNLNFSFITPKHSHDKTKHIEIMVDILKTMGIEAHTNERHDIRIKALPPRNGTVGAGLCVRPDSRHDWIDYKISGSAFRETRDRAFHHATLLFDASLKNLSPVINPPDYGIEAKGVKSVRSPVINLNQVTPNASIDKFLTATQAYFKQDFALLDQSIIQQNHSIQENIDELHTWEWIYGKTLPFQITTDKNEHVLVKHGLIDDTKERFTI